MDESHERGAWWPETAAEKVAWAVIVIMSLGCSTGGESLMPHLSGFSSSETACTPGENECSDADEICVYNPWLIDDSGVDLNDYQAWRGSECGNASDDEGRCVTRPEPEDGDYSRTVCGCDGETYETAAAAHHEGVSIDYFEPCRKLQPHLDEDASSKRECDVNANNCGPGETCLLNPFMSDVYRRHEETSCTQSEGSARVRAGTYSNGHGDEDFRPGGHAFCVSVEDDWENGYHPGDDEEVCGCDGTTYDSYADAHASGVSVDQQAPCGDSSDRTRCFPDPSTSDCESDEFCKIIPADDCYRGNSGTCIDSPDKADCPSEYEPVCGCDDTTYQNRCLAHAAEVPLQSYEKCQ